MESLKQRYHIVIDRRKYGGKRTAVSINQLSKYLPENRVNFIMKKLAFQDVFPFRVKVQNYARVDIYLK